MNYGSPSDHSSPRETNSDNSATTDLHHIHSTSTNQECDDSIGSAIENDTDPVSNALQHFTLEATFNDKERHTFSHKHGDQDLYIDDGTTDDYTDNNSYDDYCAGSFGKDNGCY